MHFLRSLTAKIPMHAKEKKSLTAKVAVDANEKISNQPQERNAKTTPSMEWPQRAGDWARFQPEQSIRTGAGAITLPWRCLSELKVEFTTIFFASSAVRLSRACLRVLGVLCGEAFLLMAAVAFESGLAAAQTGATYASELSQVYSAAQFVQARKDGCDSAEPDTRKANEAAYNAWRKRHQALLDELERRFLAMIRGASTDQKDYSKNVGKYAGEALQNLDELKRQFLSQPPEEVSRQCREFPAYLKGKDADLPKRYAAELKSIRKRKL